MPVRRSTAGSLCPGLCRRVVEGGRRFGPTYADGASERGDGVINKRIWFITGAGRGMGVDFAKAALAAGHAVVASGRDSKAVSTAVGESGDLLAVTLDVTSRARSHRRVASSLAPTPLAPRSRGWPS